PVADLGHAGVDAVVGVVAVGRAGGVRVAGARVGAAVDRIGVLVAVAVPVEVRVVRVGVRRVPVEAAAVLVDPVAARIGLVRVDRRVAVVAGVGVGGRAGRAHRAGDHLGARVAVAVAVDIGVVARRVDRVVVDDRVAVLVDPVAVLHRAVVHVRVGVVAVAA